MSSSCVTSPLRPCFSRFFPFGFPSLVVLVFILFLSPQDACAVDVTLAWDRNTEDDLVGYKIFCRKDGQDYDYDSPILGSPNRRRG